MRCSGRTAGTAGMAVFDLVLVLEGSGTGVARRPAGLAWAPAALNLSKQFISVQ